MADLIAERALYERVDENARRLLTEIGMKPLETLRCAECHLEHRGREIDIAEVANVTVVTRIKENDEEEKEE